MCTNEVCKITYIAVHIILIFTLSFFIQIKSKSNNLSGKYSNNIEVINDYSYIKSGVLYIDNHKVIKKGLTEYSGFIYYDHIRKDKKGNFWYIYKIEDERNSYYNYVSPYVVVVNNINIWSFNHIIPSSLYIQDWNIYFMLYNNEGIITAYKLIKDKSGGYIMKFKDLKYRLKDYKKTFYHHKSNNLKIIFDINLFNDKIIENYKGIEF